MKTRTRRLSKSLAAIALALAQSACGGGGGGSDASDDGGSNTAPIADAGSDQVVNVGEVVTLDGSLSSDVDGDELAYFWSLESRPADSAVYLYDDQTVNAKLANTRAGAYTLNLTVTDGSDSSTSTVSVSVNDLGGLAPVRDPVRPEIDYLKDIGVISIKSALDDPDDFSVLDTPTWSSYAPDLPEEGAVIFTINPKLINDKTSRTGSRIHCIAEWDGRGFWENKIFDDLSTCTVVVDDQGGFGEITNDPVRFEILSTDDTGRQPTVSGKVTNDHATTTIYNVGCNVRAVNGSTIVDSANLFFVSLGNIAPGMSAIDEGTFFSLSSLDGFDLEWECNWLERRD